MNKLGGVFQKVAGAIQGNKKVQSISGGLMTLLPALMIGTPAPEPKNQIGIKGSVKVVC